MVILVFVGEADRLHVVVVGVFDLLVDDQEMLKYVSCGFVDDSDVRYICGGLRPLSTFRLFLFVRFILFAYILDSLCPKRGDLRHNLRTVYVYILLGNGAISCIHRMC